MLAPTELYVPLLTMLASLEVAPHRTALLALTHVVTALLVGQSMRPASLIRASLSLPSVPARQRFKRVARTWDRPWLSPAWLSPRLVRAAVTVVAPDQARWSTGGLTHLALDTVRCGPWEVLTLGVVWHGRVLPVGWAVLAYPWLPGRFTPMVCALVRQVGSAWPADRPAHLVADRAFASRRLFSTLADLGWAYTVRLRASAPITVDGVVGTVRDRLTSSDIDRWMANAAGYGAGTAVVPGMLVIGRGLRVVSWHQRGLAGGRHHARQQAQRRSKLIRKHGGQRLGSLVTDPWVALFTTLPTWRAAVTGYRRRWATEGSYRDAQSGWDGQHGWHLDRALARLSDPAHVERVVGLWALGTLVQSWLGHQATQPRQPAIVATAMAGWTTTGRLSVWARGQLALATPELRVWVSATLRAGADRLARAPDPLARHHPTHSLAA